MQVMSLELLEGMGCQIYGKQEHLQFILDYVTPYFNINNSLMLVCEIVIDELKNFNSDLSFNIDEAIWIHYDQVGFVNISGDDTYIKYNENGSIVKLIGNKIFLFLNDSDYRTKFIPVRIVREIFYFLLKKKGYYELHSSAFSYKDSGVLIVGDGGVGKTTLVLRMVLDGRAKFISNDKVFFNPATLKIIGYPLSINVRHSTLEIVPALKNIVKKTIHYQHQDWNKFHKDPKITLAINDLKKINEVRIEKQTRLTHILFPENMFTKARIEKLDINKQLLDKYIRKHPFNNWNELLTKNLAESIEFDTVQESFNFKKLKGFKISKFISCITIKNILKGDYE